MIYIYIYGCQVVDLGLKRNQSYSGTIWVNVSFERLKHGLSGMIDPYFQSFDPYFLSLLK